MNKEIMKAYREGFKMKTYTFYDDSWWSSVCDCCEPTEIPAFNSDELTPIFGTAHSDEACLLLAVAHTKGMDSWEDIPDDLRNLTYSQLKQIAKELCIEVEIIS